MYNVSLLVTIYQMFLVLLKIYHLLNESLGFPADYLKLVEHYVQLFQFHRELIRVLQSQL